MNQANGLFLLIGICLMTNANFTFGQTCCSGGVPVSSNLGLPPSEAKTLQVAMNYDLNVLETLKSGLQTLEDDSRSRKTHALMIQVGYSFSERIAADLFLPWVRQERTISQFGNTNFTSTDGVGDAVFLLKYKLLAKNQNATTLTAGVGAKFPTGASNLTDDRGIGLNADLQPGSGALDGILWSQFTQVIPTRPSMNIMATGIFSYKGENSAYFGSQVYQFGPELRLRLGISDRLLVGKQLLDPTIMLSYRLAMPDQVNHAELPSTGGNWLFINPGMTYWIGANTSANINVELPLRADITGTQVTPTYRLNVGLFQRIQLGKRSPLMVDPLN